MQRSSAVSAVSAFTGHLQGIYRALQGITGHLHCTYSALQHIPYRLRCHYSQCHYFLLSSFPRPVLPPNVWHPHGKGLIPTWPLSIIHYPFHLYSIPGSLLAPPFHPSTLPPHSLGGGALASRTHLRPSATQPLNLLSLALLSLWPGHAVN